MPQFIIFTILKQVAIGPNKSFLLHSRVSKVENIAL